MAYLQEERHELYRRAADVTVDRTKLSDHETAQVIVEKLSRHGRFERARVVKREPIAPARPREDVPQEILDFLFSLPASPVTPAWV